MDKSVTIFEGVPRRFNLAPKLGIVGTLPEKTGVVNWSFQSWNFSFVVAGKGFYELDGVRHTVQAPMVLTQWPGQTMNYGPEGRWEELYLIYPEPEGAALAASGLFDRSRFLWPVPSPERFFARFEMFLELLEEESCRDYPDRIDLAASGLILDSLLPEERGMASGLERELQLLSGRFREAPEIFYDFDDCAEKFGVSLSTFRRRFKARFGQPPAEYLLTCRIRRARKLLVSSSLRIGEIAGRCGFSDPLYFSRRFRLECGLTPTEYRRRYRFS